MSRNACPIPALRALMLSTALACTVAPPNAMAWPFGSEQVEGNGNVTRQARKVESFNGIALGLPGRLELRNGNVGSVDSVTVETDDNLQALIETRVEDGMLRIRPAKRNLNLRTRNLKIAADSARVSIAGSGDATVWAKNDLRASIAGSGDVGYYGDPKVSRSVAGSGEVRRIGNAPR